ncbi:MAG: hypothetical protein ACD_67C00161G0001 [uncultured bacterium]|nr:MAG: hypothetical protein ACD_67C00161G0001 [uncultured bacterium]
MMAVFTFGFYEFAKFSSGMEAGGKTASEQMMQKAGNFITQGPLKINFAEGNPKIFLGVNGFDQNLAKVDGSISLADNSMIIGAKEAGMMKEEKLIQKPGDILKDFFGIPAMKVAGIIEETGTELDELHIVNRNTFSNLAGVAEVKALLSGSETKLFYFVSGENIPEKLQKNIANDSFGAVTIGGRRYQPIYIGSAEAKVMTQEKLFQKEGDRLDNFFGNDVIIAGILPETKTILDNFHFVGAEFQISK